MSEQPEWIRLLSDEDLNFLKRFILASGSLKELAGAYGISYPTVRLRLDRLIAKVKVFDSHARMSDFERTVRALFADSKIDMSTLKVLLAAHEKELKGGTHAKSDDRTTADTAGVRADG